MLSTGIVSLFPLKSSSPLQKLDGKNQLRENDKKLMGDKTSSTGSVSGKSLRKFNLEENS